MKPTKICCFCEKWESGGIESFLHNVLLHMDLRCIQVDIVAADLSDSVFTEPLQRHGIRFIELSGKQQNLRENYHKFRELLQAEKYDVVHLNVFHGLSLYYAYLAKRMGVPVRIAHSHNTALRKSRTRPLKMLVHRVASTLFTDCATGLWACSRPAADFLFSKRDLCDRGFRFIPNGIDIGRIRFDIVGRKQTRERLGLQGKFVIGNIGRLCYQKNQSFLLDVFAGIIQRRSESRLLLVGEGEEKIALQRKAASLGILDAVVFYGVSKHVEKLLWAMDVFAFPSRFEGLGIAAVEAQAAGLPVLCSENIPQEAIMGQAMQIPLSAGPEVWADTLLRIKVPDRNLGADLVAAAGFDVSAVAEQIRKAWMG